MIARSCAVSWAQREQLVFASLPLVRLQTLMPLRRLGEVWGRRLGEQYWWTTSRRPPRCRRLLRCCWCCWTVPRTTAGGAGVAVAGLVCGTECALVASEKQLRAI